MRRFIDEKPLALVASPMRTDRSLLFGAADGRRGTSEARRAEGRQEGYEGRKNRQKSAGILKRGRQKKKQK